MPDYSIPRVSTYMRWLTSPLLALGACTSQIQNPNDSDSDAESSSACKDAEIRCDADCIDPDSSLRYCGAEADCLDENAGEPCDNDAICLHGRCQRKIWQAPEKIDVGGALSGSDGAYHQSFSASMDPLGNVAVGWFVDSGLFWKLEVVRFDFVNNSWSAPESLDDPELDVPRTAHFFRLFHDAQGNALAFWQLDLEQQEIERWGPLWWSRWSVQSGTWDKPRRIYDDIPLEQEPPAEFPCVAMSPDGRAFAAWRNYPEGGVVAVNEPDETDWTSKTYADFRVFDRPEGQACGPVMLRSLDDGGAVFAHGINDAGWIRFDSTAHAWSEMETYLGADYPVRHFAHAQTPSGDIFSLLSIRSKGLAISRFNPDDITSLDDIRIVGEGLLSACMAADAIGNVLVMWLRGNVDDPGFYSWSYDISEDDWQDAGKVAEDVDGQIYRCLLAGDDRKQFTVAYGVYLESGRAELHAAHFDAAARTWSAPERVGSARNIADPIAVFAHPDQSTKILWARFDRAPYTEPQEGDGLYITQWTAR